VRRVQSTSLSKLIATCRVYNPRRSNNSGELLPGSPSLPPDYENQGADTPVPVPIPIPDLSGDGDGASVPDLPGGGDAPPSPSPISSCPESGTLPRPRARFAEIGDQAAVLEYPKGAEAFAQVWSHNSHWQCTATALPLALALAVALSGSQEAT
jgi:hypothetical protein